MTTVWLAVEVDGTEVVSCDELERVGKQWFPRPGDRDVVILPTGTIEKILGRKLTWDDEAVMVEE